MKNLLRFFSCLVVLLGMCFTVLPQDAHAEFPERPVGFVVMDQDGDVDGAIYKEWRSVVKWAYHFPYYKITDDGTAQKLVTDAVRDGAKVEQATMAALAEKAKVDVLVLVRVYELDEEMVSSWALADDHDTYVRVRASADMFVYKKDGEKFLKKKLRERHLYDMGNVTHPEETIKWELSKLVNTMEGRPIIGA